MRRALGVAVLGLTAVMPAATQDVRVDDVLSRAAGYVETFFRRFSNVVAEERFEQRRQTLRRPDIPPRQRSLRSEYLILRLAGAGEVFEFRDVISIDLRPLGGRGERLERLLLNPSSEALQKAAAIALDNERLSLRAGIEQLLVSTPLAGLSLLQPQYSTRLRVEAGKIDAGMGPRVRILSFSEEARPTILRRRLDDAPVSGRFWIEEDSGRVRRTELRVERASIVTEFRFDPALEIDVPASMEIVDRDGQAEFVGRATYRGFRAFKVTPQERLN